MPDSDTLQQLQSAVEFYSDTFITVRAGTPDRLEGIRNMLASLDIGTGKEDDIPESKMHFWQRWVDNAINSKLSSVYKTPLRRITRTGRNLNKDGNATAFFSDPIQMIAIMMVCAKIILNEYTDIDPNTNEPVNTLWGEAMDFLEELGGYSGQVGTAPLEGQDLRGRSIFVPPGAMPRPIPGMSRLG
ncbi:hypothetical protein LCGC14_2891830 [marine sediment metagenome]|uniref:Uncharacterized protein n=1 Tax=marine sediment metagenome TaxID=412755 RepID=A0A0F8XX06_9ZZZZ